MRTVRLVSVTAIGAAGLALCLLGMLGLTGPGSRGGFGRLARIPAFTLLSNVALAVNPEARRLGTGAALMGISEWASTESGARCTRIMVDALRPQLVRWYERMGYVVIDERWVKSRGIPLPRRIARALWKRLTRAQSPQRP